MQRLSLDLEARIMSRYSGLTLANAANNLLRSIDPLLLRYHMNRGGRPTDRYIDIISPRATDRRMKFLLCLSMFALPPKHIILSK